MNVAHHSEQLRQACYRPPVSRPCGIHVHSHTFHNHVLYQNCRFPAYVDLHNARFEQTLAFEDCFFLKDGLCLCDTRVAGRFSLRGCTFRDRPAASTRRERGAGQRRCRAAAPDPTNNPPQSAVKASVTSV